MTHPHTDRNHYKDIWVFTEIQDHERLLEGALELLTKGREIADTLGVSLDTVGDLSLQSSHPATISNICTIYAQQEVAASLAEGVPLSDLLAGVHQSLADRICRMVNRLRVEDSVIVTGGGAKNRGLIKTLSEQLGHKVLVPEDPLITGALGAALMGKEIVEKAKKNHTPLETKERILEEVEIL